MIELKPHQLEAVEKLSSGKILLGGVGTGKTLTALAWALQQGDKDIHVVTTAKKRDLRDWENEAALLGTDRITVESWNNIGKFRDVKDSVVLLDEQRLVGSGAWTKHFLAIAKANDWILLSATPGDTWLDYVPVFVANGFYKNRTEFKRDHVVYSPYSKFPKVDRYTSVGTLVRHRNAITVEMPYERHTTRHVELVEASYDREKYNLALKNRWDPYNNEPMKDIAGLFRVLRRIVNSDMSRLAWVKALYERHERLIVFYNFNYELEELRKLGDIAEIREWNGHKHEEIPSGDRWIYLVQYVAGAEGWNCVTTNAICFYSLTYSYKIFEQAQGRIDRLNTKFVDLWYYVLKSNSSMDRAIWRSLKDKKSFNEPKTGF